MQMNPVMPGNERIYLPKSIVYASKYNKKKKSKLLEAYPLLLPTLLQTEDCVQLHEKNSCQRVPLFRLNDFLEDVQGRF